ncbi:MAG: Rne/Rng family ribonuclease [Candidatus Sumerlaeaceae bacterium]
MKKVLINVEERELRVAILEDEQLTELYIEALDEKTILNNIYKGRIEGILPGLKAAFVNIGLERNAFLHFDDVRGDLLWAKYRENNPAAEIPSRPASSTAETDEPAEAERMPAIAAATPVEEQREAESEADIAVADEAEAQPSTAEEREEGDDDRPRRRRGRRGGRKRHKSDADQPFDPVRDEVLDADIDDEDEDDEEAITEAPAGQPAVSSGPSQERTFQEGGVAPGGPQSDQRTNPRSERQRRRRERWEQKKLERQSRRQQGVPGGDGAPRGNTMRAPQPHPTTTAMANAWVPPAERGAAGTRGAANPYDVFSPYSMPAQPSKRQWRRQAQQDTTNWGNQRSPYAQNPNDRRESQEDFFGPRPQHRAYVPGADDDDDRQPNFGPVRSSEPFYDEDDNAPMPGNERFPGASGQGNSRPRHQGQGQGDGGQAARRKRRGGGRNRQMKRRGNQSYYAVRAKKSDSDDAKSAAAKKRTKAAEPVEEKTPARVKKIAPVAARSAIVARPKRAAKSDDTVKAKASIVASKTTARVRKTEAETKPAVADKNEKKAARPPAREKKVAIKESASARARAAAAEARAARLSSRKKTGTVSAREEAAAKAAPSTSPASPVAETQHVQGSPEPQKGSAETPERPAKGQREDRHRDRRGRRSGRRGRGAAPAEAGVQSTSDTAQTGETGTSTEAQPGTSQPQTGFVPVALPTAPQQDQRPGRHDRHRDRGGRDQQPQARRWNRPPLFTETYKKGDEVMVQVIKEEIGMKGARISTYVSLPGRYLVLLPYPNEEGGISRKVEDITERKRLKRILKEISNDETAFIIRTAGIYRDEKDIRGDVDFLTHEWTAIADRYKQAEPTQLVYDDHDIIYRLARDVFDDNVSEILIDSHVEAEKLKQILDKLIPSLTEKVKVYSGAENIFQKFQVEKQIQKAARRKVWLKSGGYLIIDEAEALTAIDVNTGKAVGKDDQEKLILKTNLEASRAVARELKLRDIGGLIVIDFIDMKDPRNREQVVNELKMNLRKDRSKTSVSTISEFGLVEMTRKRVRRSLRKTLFMDCPYCQGAGVVLNEQQIWLHIKHELVKTLESTKPAPSLNVTVNSRIRGYVDQNYRDAIRRLEQRYDVEIRFSMSDVFHVENYAIEKAGAVAVPAVAAAAGGR